MEIGETISAALSWLQEKILGPSTTFRMHMDADRDGAVDNDWRGLENWSWGTNQKGVIILCNNDDDQAANATDHSDNQVNGGNDRDELAPLVIRRVGPAAPASMRAFLEVAPADRQLIRIFDGRAAGSPEVLGPSTTHRFQLANLNFQEKEFGIEACRYAGTGFNGTVFLTFTLEDGGRMIHSQRALLRVAPWIMPNHLDPAERVYVVNAGAFNARFRTQLGLMVTAAGCTLQQHAEPGDIWMQDCMELGYSNLPGGHGFRSTMRAPRDRPLSAFPWTLLAADFGYHEQGTLVDDTTFDSTGNLEVTPPVTSEMGKRYPFGRIYFGPGRPREWMDADFRAFLHAQTVQDPIEVDTGWLAVGHVDEILSIVPAPGAQGFKLLLASPQLAYQILDANDAAHGADRLLVGRDFDGHAAEVSIHDFLTSGIPDLGLVARPLRVFNMRIQVRLNRIQRMFMRELGLQPTDVLRVPILYMPNADNPIFADALTAGMVNMLVINQHCIVPKPFGPVVGGLDLFEEDLRGKLTPLGLTVQFLDDWYEYHVNLGEVHCGTNTLRRPTSANWWEFVP